MKHQHKMMIGLQTIYASPYFYGFGFASLEKSRCCVSRLSNQALMDEII
jgi:hypothetical protein